MSNVTDCIDFLKQKLYALAKRIRRFRERWNRYNQNGIFQKTNGVYKGRSEDSIVNREIPNPDLLYHVIQMCRLLEYYMVGI